MPTDDGSPDKYHSESIPEAVSRIIAAGSIGVLITLIQAAPKNSDGLGRKLLVNSAGAVPATSGSLGNEALNTAAVRQARLFLDTRADTRVFQVNEFAAELEDWSEARLLFERLQLEPRLVICGAGHVGASLARLGLLMGYRVTLIDDRAEFLTRNLFPDQRIELIETASWSDAVVGALGAGYGVAIAIVTRGHSEDEQCLRAALTVTADYVGLIGSKRRTGIVLERLRQSGADEARLAKVHAPVGLDIGAVTPEEVALAIMAEVISVRRSGKGTPLSAWRRK